MSRDDMNDLLTGAALVALGYALYKHFKVDPTKNAAVIAAQTPLVGGQVGAFYDQTAGAPYSQDSVGGRIKLADMLGGTLTGLEGSTNYLPMLNSTAWN